jgi:hypothetical protein
MRVVRGRPLRVLDFDIENRPLSYWVPDRPTAEVTAIAAGWIGESKVDACLLGDVSMVEMLTWFAELYQQADMVTGHYIRMHDLPILNGAMLENGLPPLGAKLSSDTKLDLINWKDLPKTQEHLADMFGVRAPKVQMSQQKWRDANRLTEKGLGLTYKRVVGDVKQHRQLRQALLDRNLLKVPRVWSPM